MKWRVYSYSVRSAYGIKGENFLCYKKPVDKILLAFEDFNLMSVLETP
jgi:hypothetical protein